MLFWGQLLTLVQCAGVCGCLCTLFHQQISLDSVESLTLPTSFLQFLLAVYQPPFLLPHRPLVVLVNLLQLLI